MRFADRLDRVNDKAAEFANSQDPIAMVLFLHAMNIDIPKPENNFVSGRLNNGD